MPIYQRPSHPHALGEQQARQREADRRLGLHETRQLLTVDRGVTASVPAPGEGQLMVEGTDLKFYAQSAWHTAGQQSAMFLYISDDATQSIPNDGTTVDLDADNEIINTLANVGWSNGYEGMGGEGQWGLYPPDGYTAEGEDAWLFGANLQMHYSTVATTDIYMELFLRTSGRLFATQRLFIPAARAPAQDATFYLNAMTLIPWPVQDGLQGVGLQVELSHWSDGTLVTNAYPAASPDYPGVAVWVVKVH